MLVRVIICSAVILTIVTGSARTGNIEEDEDDEDHFGMSHEQTYLHSDFYRNRRSQEEGFYQTLLSRSEPQHVFKRSHGTEDFETHKNPMFVTDRDWSGSSKISDADRKELEELFSKLNADDSDSKSDVTRSLPDDDGLSPVDDLAYRYSAWLMGQPSNRMAQALTQKAQVDNRLTKLFFDKRGLDLVLPNQEPNDNQKKSIITKARSTQDAPRPETDTAGLQNMTAKHLIMSGPKLCTDDSSKCLCTRACYPDVAVSIIPCKCEGNSANLAQHSPIKNVTSPNLDAKLTAKAADVTSPEVSTSAQRASVTSNVGTFPPQAPAVAKTEFLPLASVPIKNLVNVKQEPQSAVLPHVVNGSTSTSDTVPEISSKTIRTSIKAPQVLIGGANTNASVKSDVSAADESLEAALVTDAPAHVLSKAPNSTSVEPAESKSIEPIHSTKLRLRQELGAPPAASATPVVPSNASAGIFGSGPVYVTHPSYQGCFKDRKPVRDLPKRFTRFDTTPESCIMECKYQNYKFAGVQYGYLCFCGNAFGRYGRVADKDCNSFCNGDPKRKCGAFWHNSVYSVDGKPYDPGLFDFVKVDEEERIHDQLSPPPVQVSKKSTTKMENHVNIQGANAATHLVDAAQATLKAAKKLLPGVSKKHKIGKEGKRLKREDDEDDAELMLERENALTALKAAHNILQKTNFEKVKRNAEKEKRSINEDFDPYNPDDGKDLLKAYLSSVDTYNRQTRSVDEEEEDDSVTEKDNFQYRHQSNNDLKEGQFVDKYADNAATQENAETLTAKKRSSEDDVDSSSSSRKGKKEKRSASNETNKQKAQTNATEVTEEKRSVPITGENEKTVSDESKITSPIKREVAEPIDQNQAEATTEESHPEKLTTRSVEEDGELNENSDKDPQEQQPQPSRIQRRNLPERRHTRSSKAHASGHVMQTRDISSSAHGSGAGVDDRRKRSLGESIQRLHEGSGGGYKKKRSVREPIRKVYRDREGGYKKKRSINKLTQKAHEGSGGGYKKKRSISEPVITQIRVGSGNGHKMRRSVSEPVQIVHQREEGYTMKRRSLDELLQIKQQGKRHRSIKKRRSLKEDNNVFVSKWYTQLQQNKLDEKIRRSLVEAKEPLKIFPVYNAESAASVKAKRDLSSQYPDVKVIKRKKVQKPKVVGQPGERREITPAVTTTQKTDASSEENVPWDKRRRSIGSEKVEFIPVSQSERSWITRSEADDRDVNSKQVRKRRELPSNNLSDGALKMAARSDDINDIEKSLQRLESIEKRDKIEKPEDNVVKESESGDGEHSSADGPSGEENRKITHDDGDKESKMVRKRSSEDEQATTDAKKSKLSGEITDDLKLKNDVERGVDSLLNLVVELYKQQKTIKNFENSVRTLRHDILKELDISSKDKHAATKKVRNAIQSAAKERLHTLTSSIEKKITEFAKRHPESVKQAKLATSLLPKIPMTDKKLAESKREITRRSAEFDNVEDGFVEPARLPDILKEHFKRNAERDVEDVFEPVKRSAENEDEELHEILKHSKTGSDEEPRKPRKRSSEDDVSFEPVKSNTKRDAEERHVKKRSMKDEVKQTEINGEKTLSRMHRDVSESEEEGLYDDEQNEDYEKLFH